MYNMDRLGKNIRSLRNAYGESQEQLGAAIYVEKNTVSSYETGRTQPKNEILTAISKHYTVCIDDLLLGDFSYSGETTVNFKPDTFWKVIDKVFPVISTEQALQNQNFRIAFDAQTDFYAQCRSADMDKIDIPFELCLDNYSEAIEDEKIAVESGANLLGLLCLFMIAVNSLTLVKDNPAYVSQLAKIDKNVREFVENAPSLEAEISVNLDESGIHSTEYKEAIMDMLNLMRDTKEWSDLAYYYMALFYIYNLVDNNSTRSINNRIGASMLNAFALMGNQYAHQFLSCWDDDSDGMSSQIVDDN